jgi:hypothetical protein
MALIDLKTNLKSLKYGSDRIGGGNSGQPYIQTNIGEGIIGNVDDGLIRGGGAGAIKSSAVDTLRIGKFLADAPRGPLFIAKQVGLQLSNPKLESKAPRTGIGFLDRLLVNFNDKVGIGPTRLYNLGVNTLKQIPVNAIGIHFNRHGILPVQDDTTKYLAVVQNNNLNTGTSRSELPQNSTNRLLRYTAKLLPTPKPSIIRPQSFLSQILSLIPGGSLLAKPQQQTIDDYIGGPGSVYGIGRTLIKRYDYTANGLNKKLPTERGKINYVGALNLTNQWNAGAVNFTAVSTILDSIAGAFRIPQGINLPKVSNDFISVLNSFDQINQTAVDYKTDNIPAGANGTVDSPTARKYTTLRNQVNKQSNINQPIINGLNGINVFKTQNPNINRGAKNFAYLGTNLFGNNRKTTAFDRTDRDEKLLAIKFTIIDPFINNPKSINFSAYIKGFRETFDGTWNETNYVGRSESFYTYNKFKRGASFNLDIPCFNSKQLIDKHKALETLLSTTAGSYSGNNFLGGVLTTIKLGNYLDNQYAIINSISYEVPDESSWDVDKQLAMYIKATFNITIINKVLPQYTPTNTDVFFNTNQK